MTTKKRASLFGALFAKEPSAVAFEQMTQKLMAEHGELSARAIPGVSMAKMPDSVPKVNSKWDGVPKVKDAREPDGKASKTPSAGSSSIRSRSAGPPGRELVKSSADRLQRRPSNSSSYRTSDSASSRPQVPRAHASTDTTASNPEASSPLTEEIQDNRRPVPQQSLRSPSGSSLPEITSFFPSEIPATPKVPAKFKAAESRQAIVRVHTDSNNTAGAPTDPYTPEPAIDGGEDDTSVSDTTPSGSFKATLLPAHTPNELTGRTLSNSSDRRVTSMLRSTPEDAVLLISGPDVLGPPARARRRQKPHTEAFFAGEALPVEIPTDDMQESGTGDVSNGQRLAHPLLDRQLHMKGVQQDVEQRPVSSRVRLGLRASMLIDTGNVPWDLPDSKNATSPKVTTPNSPKYHISPKFRPKSFGIFSRSEK